MGFEYDFCGWATKNDLPCSDGRTIRRGAFAHQDGTMVPLVWNHDHKGMENVIGHALLQNREDGVYTYGVFNDTPNGQNAKTLVQHGDIVSLSIFANKLQEKGGNVTHGTIREVSLVYAGANPGAYIENVIAHGDDGESAVMYTGEDIIAHGGMVEDSVSHADDTNLTVKEVIDGLSDTKKKVAFFLIAKAVEEDGNASAPSASAAHAEDMSGDGPTVADVWETFTENEKKAVYAVIAFLKQNPGSKSEAAAEHSDYDYSEEDSIMHMNMFDASTQTAPDEGVLTHADQAEILNLAKTRYGSLREALKHYAESTDHLAHGIDEIETLFPEYKNLGPAAPEMLTTDQGWITKVMNGVHKSPISRIRTRQMDVKSAQLRAKGYKKGNLKTEMGDVRLLKRTTDPQTIYVKDSMHRDDIIDITDFDVVDYEYKLMKMTMNEEVATAIMIGDGRDDADEDKISEEHVRSILNDDDLYTIHYTIDTDATTSKLQGDDTSKHFGEDYIWAESLVEGALFAREDYKGSGALDFYCAPRTVNKMLMARDMNGRRIYSDVSDLAKALNVGSIITAEQFAGKTRTTKDGDTKNLLGIFVNLNDYQVGATKGGEITQFNQFDIDFNKEKYLIETRMSGALVRVKSAIVLEEDA